MLASTRNGQVEDDNPRNAYLSPHLQVDRTQARIEGGTHEDIVDGVAGHTNRGLRCHSVKVGKERNTKTVNHSYGHEVTIVVNDFSEAEDASPVENEGNNNGGIPALNSVAVIHEGLVSKGRDGETLLLKSGKNPSDE